MSAEGGISLFPYPRQLWLKTGWQPFPDKIIGKFGKTVRNGITPFFKNNGRLN
jgi:hypothetical protein